MYSHWCSDLLYLDYSPCQWRDYLVCKHMIPLFWSLGYNYVDYFLICHYFVIFGLLVLLDKYNLFYPNINVGIFMACE